MRPDQTLGLSGKNASNEIDKLTSARSMVVFENQEKVAIKSLEEMFRALKRIVGGANKHRG